jgi:hypothetical protein
VSRALYLINFIGFQTGWFICIMTGNLLSAIFTSLFLIAHVLLLKKYIPTFSLAKELSWLLVFFFTGLAVETLFLNTGVLIFEHSEKLISSLFLPPPWLLCLWLLFGTSMRTSLRLLFEKRWIGYLSALIFAPASYYAGDKLNISVEIGTPLVLHLSIIAFVWLCAIGFIFIVKKYYFEDLFNDH